MDKFIFKRKCYKTLLEWKEKHSNRNAILVKGAKGVGKTTLVKEFAKNEFKTYLLIDFKTATKELISLFDDMQNLDWFFLKLQQFSHVRLYEHDSVIIFDEVEFFPQARQAIKYLVADGRYKYIETGSYLERKKNLQNILIPSEEQKLTLRPLDFEEFLWATGDETTADTIKQLLKNKVEAGKALHLSLMKKFNLYMLIGGMPEAIKAYTATNNLEEVDSAKRQLIKEYEDDLIKIKRKGFAYKLFKAIPENLRNQASRFILSNVKKGARSVSVQKLLPEILSSYALNIAYKVTNPNEFLGLSSDNSCYKLFLTDTGLFITLAFIDKKYTENVIYNKLLSDKLEANLGYVYENAVAQMLISKGYKLFYYTMKSETSNHLYEVDFLISEGDKISPIEVKSGNYRQHKSLDVFCEKFSRRVKNRYVIHTKDYSFVHGIHYLPIYMVPFL